CPRQWKQIASSNSSGSSLRSDDQSTCNLLLVDFDRIFGLARQPAYGHGFAAWNTDAQRLDAFFIASQIRVGGSPAHMLPANRMVSTARLCPAGGGLQSREPDRPRLPVQVLQSARRARLGT